MIRYVVVISMKEKEA